VTQDCPDRDAFDHIRIKSALRESGIVASICLSSHFWAGSLYHAKLDHGIFKNANEFVSDYFSLRFGSMAPFNTRRNRSEASTYFSLM
jgi:hypothetical protein